MSDDTLIPLPRPTSSTYQGAKLQWESPTLSVHYDYEHDDGTIEWVSLHFENVLAFNYCENSLIKAEHVTRSGYMQRLPSSPWLKEILKRRKEFLQLDQEDPTRFSHFILYWDDNGSLEIIAAGFLIKEFR